ncbi:MAG: 2TM domain-containing protein [Lutibacter sp.]|uniref:2TM domain-containing protein n=1 Tax=Lutibacter sp. TaxID=1925666 RepID=UPI0017AC2A23|nr:2TM domain-containing protein [Lutibacter sp.]MBT8317017.1 2TM domain-containing protein [Lutibacter sp.]NNJ57877.1 2TM domain-containing protein [Lutibacter sp.]
MLNFKMMENNNYTKEQQYVRAKKKVKSIKGFYSHLLVYLVVNGFILGSRFISTGDWEAFWEWQSYSTAIFWGIGLAFHAFSVFGIDVILGKDWEDRKIKQLMDKDRTNKWE